MPPRERKLEISLPTLIEHTSFYQEGTRTSELRDIVPATDPPLRPPPRARTISHGRSQSAPSRFLNNVVRGNRHTRTASDTAHAGAGGVESLRRMTDGVLASLRERELRAEREEVLISAPIPLAAQAYPLDAEPRTPTNAHISDKDHLGLPKGVSPKPSPVPSGSGRSSVSVETLVEPPLPPLPLSWTRLYSVASPRERLWCLVPAIIFTLAAAMVGPYMTTLMGSAFSELAMFWISQRTSEDKDKMIKFVRGVILKIVVIALANVGFTYAKNALWVTYGELTTNRLRRMVYDGVQEKPMEWYDFGMGTAEADEKGAVGAAGLMGKFARETDEVRAATGASSGNTLGGVSTTIACLVLALVSQPVLTIVTLSAMPLMIITAAGTQRVVEPMYQVERRCFAKASTSVERATSALATVKAQNAQDLEVARFKKAVEGARDSLVKQAYAWATSFGMTDFLMFAMYAVGCWYGAKIVADGKAQVDQVLTVIWASLTASTSLQGVMPQLTILTKGNASLASILSIIQSRDGNYDKRGFRSGPLPHSHSDPNRPRRFRGQFDFQRVSFHYPSRPDVTVLRDITLFLPEGEATFIVGGSGSGKSTVAQLLLRMYKPVRGAISLDNRGLENFPDTYTRQHVAAVQQGCILFDMSVHDNVAMGIVGAGADMYGEIRRPEDITRADVVDACKMASIHDFIESLPEGYDTMLGTGGSQLSGGQRQRLAIARARIRDPTVLILDEATSALDATSRVDVFNAIKAWRRGSTTIVITHDLSQITAQDYVYVMAEGVVADHGFRNDLETREGPFTDMAARQAMEPLPPRDDFEWCPAPAKPLPKASAEERRLSRIVGWNISAVSLRPSRPSSIASLADLGNVETQRRTKTPVKVKRAGMILHTNDATGHARKVSADSVPRSISQESLVVESDLGHAPAGFPVKQRHSMQAPPSAYNLSRAQKRLSWTSEDLGNGPYRRYSASASTSTVRLQHQESQDSMYDASRWRRDESRVSAVSIDGKYDKADGVEEFELVDVVLGEEKRDSTEAPAEVATGKLPGLASLIWRYYPSLPSKWLLWLGLLGAVGHGVAIPVYSFYLAQLLALIGTKDSGQIVQQGGVLIALSAALALAAWIEHFGGSTVAARWNAQMRASTYNRVLAQDKGWFDASVNAPAQLTQRLVKDVEDMRNLFAMILPAIVVTCVMIGLGIIWALVVGWQMTLVGISIVPVVGVVYMLSEGAVQRAEERNKGRREAVAKTFFETLANVRGIRGMALEDCFRERFAREATECRSSGFHSALVVSVAQATSAGLPQLVQALLLFVAATFIANGTMTYPASLQVLTLVILTLTFSSQVLAFLPLLTKAKVAARDFHRLAALSLATAEAQGDARPAITGGVRFEDVSFTYPERPDVTVLAHFSLSVMRGESVAIVGSSGCGKSTVAALLQRLYEPGSGRVTLDGQPLSSISVSWLRRHIGVVSQTANLFDDTALANLRYGAEVDVPLMEVHAACRAANIHDFIESLPRGYQTKLGENASLISGGQAQRIQIARALIRKPRILILDECTSALDVENQRIILDTIDAISRDCTTLFITHSTEAMKRCDRIACLQDGRVTEDGTWSALIAKGGTFAQLMRSGEWE